MTEQVKVLLQVFAVTWLTKGSLFFADRNKGIFGIYHTGDLYCLHFAKLRFMIFLRRRSWFLVLGILTSKQMVPATLFSFLLRIQNNFKNLMLDVGLFIFTESHIGKMLKICWFFPIQRCKMQICIQNMYFSLLLWSRCYLLSERLFQHFFSYCNIVLKAWSLELKH